MALAIVAVFRKLRVAGAPEGEGPGRQLALERPQA
jgi:hypothetical protein